MRRPGGGRRVVNWVDIFGGWGRWAWGVSGGVEVWRCGDVEVWMWGGVG